MTNLNIKEKARTMTRFIVISLASILLIGCEAGDNMQCQIVEKKINDKDVNVSFEYSSCDRAAIKIVSIQNKTGIRVKVFLKRSIEEEIYFEVLLEGLETKLINKEVRVPSEYTANFLITTETGEILSILDPYL